MKTNTNKHRLTLIISAIITATGIIANAVVATTTSQATAENETSRATVQATAEPETLQTTAKEETNAQDVASVNPYSFRIGNQGYSFVAYTKGGNDTAEAQVTENPEMVDYIIVTRTDDAVKDLDLGEALTVHTASFRNSWSYKQFDYDGFLLEDITNELSDNILKCTVGLITPTEEEFPKYDLYKDGEINVSDYVYARQIYAANPANYLRGAITLQEIVNNICPLADKYEAVQVSIDHNSWVYDPIGEIREDVPKTPWGEPIPDYEFQLLKAGAQYYGIDNYRIEYNEDDVIMFGFGIWMDYENMGIHQVLPNSYNKHLMIEKEYLYYKDESDDLYKYVIWASRTGAFPCNFGHSILHTGVPVDYYDKVLEPWYLIPVDENGEDILQITGGSQYLKEVINNGFLYDPPALDET